MTREEKILNYFKKGQKMDRISPEEEMECIKAENPVRWIGIMSDQIDHYIKEYNELAAKNGLDVIVAFKMTPAELAEGMKETLLEK